MNNLTFNSVMPLMVLMTVWTSLSGCRKNDKDESCDCKNTRTTTCVFYEQTYCSDPWGNHPETPKLISSFKEHFDGLGVNISDVCLDDKGTQEDCMACSCKSGKRFLGRVKNNELKKAKEKGLKVK
jgi:hypothetical protein